MASRSRRVLACRAPDGLPLRPEPFRSLATDGEVPVLLYQGRGYVQSNAILLFLAEQSSLNVTQSAALAGFNSDTQLRRTWHQAGLTGSPSPPKNTTI